MRNRCDLHGGMLEPVTCHFLGFIGYYFEAWWNSIFGCRIEGRLRCDIYLSKTVGLQAIATDPCAIYAGFEVHMA